MALSSFRCASFFRIVRSHRLFLIAFFLLLLAAFVFRFFCSLPLSADSDVHIFQSALDDRIRHSSSRLDSLVSVHVNGASFPQLYALVASDEERDLTYGIYRHDTLVFWSNNQAEIPPHYHARIWANPFLHLPHAWSVRLIRKREPYTYVALIKIKNDWARPNEYLINDFATGFRMSSEVRVIEGSPNDPYPVFSSQSLQNEGTNEETHGPTFSPLIPTPSLVTVRGSFLSFLMRFSLSLFSCSFGLWLRPIAGCLIGLECLFPMDFCCCCYSACLFVTAFGKHGLPSFSVQTFSLLYGMPPEICFLRSDNCSS